MIGQSGRKKVAFRQQGLVGRIRYESDMLVELLPAPSDNRAFRLRRLRQEARVALKAINFMIDRISTKAEYMLSGDVLTTENAHGKMRLVMLCLKKWIESFESDSSGRYLYTKLTFPALDAAPSTPRNMKGMVVKITHSLESIVDPALISKKISKRLAKESASRTTKLSEKFYFEEHLYASFSLLYHKAKFYLEMYTVAHLASNSPKQHSHCWKEPRKSTSWLQKGLFLAHTTAS
jgi:hypothetical protein